MHSGAFTYTLLGAVRSTTEAVERTAALVIDAFGNRPSYDRTGDESRGRYTQVYQPHSTRLTGVGGRFFGGERDARDTLTQGYDLAGNLTGVTHNSWVNKQQPGDVGPRWENTSFSTTRNRYASDGRLSFADRSTSEDVDRTDPNLHLYGYKHLVSNASLGRGVYEEYRYDALGRRVWVRAHREPYCDADDRSRNTDCLSAVQRTVWDGDQVLYEIRQEAQNATPATTLELDSSSLYPGRSGHFGITGYTHGPTIDRPLSMRRDLGSSAGGLKQLTLHRDWRGMVSTSTYAVGPDSGTRAECAFTGETPVCLPINWPATNHTVSRARSLIDTGPPSWYGTLSQEHRDATGTLYKRNRTYDPVTGRFTQEDPIGLAGGINLYGFGDGDPVNFSDPFGLCPLPGWHAKIACLVGAAVTATPAGQRVADRGSQLMRNLAESGVRRQTGEAAHHIVAKAAERAAPARDALQRVGVGINDAVNGVILPATKDFVGQASNHLTLHTKRYYDAVNEALANVQSRQQAVEALRKIAEMLRTSTFPR
jgi:RHS repeat-associated protein